MDMLLSLKLEHLTEDLFIHKELHPFILSIVFGEDNDEGTRKSLIDYLKTKVHSKCEAVFLPLIAKIVSESVDPFFLPTLEELIYEQESIDLPFLLYVGIGALFGVQIGIDRYTSLLSEVLGLIKEPFEPSSEEYYRKTKCKELQSLFYRFLYSVTEEKRWEKSEEESLIDAPLFLLLAHFQKKLSPITIPLDEELDCNKRNFGLFAKQNDNFSLSLLFSGQGSPFGKWATNRSMFSLFGPAHLPLNQTNLFGTHRLIHDSDRFDEIEVDEGSIKGWTQMVSPEGPKLPGNIWFEMEGKIFLDQVTLSIRIEDFSKESPLPYFVFFLKADRITIHQKTYEKSLEQYRGEASSILIENKDQKIILNTSQKVSLHLIPLAGDTYFWGTNYLIAYELNNKNAIYTWTFNKNILNDC